VLSVTKFLFAYFTVTLGYRRVGATRPKPSAAFLKNCCTKKLLSCSAVLWLQKLISITFIKKLLQIAP
jgi:hypothetical protein